MIHSLALPRRRIGGKPLKRTQHLQPLLVNRGIIDHAAIHFHPRVGEEGRGPVANYQTGIDTVISQQPRRHHRTLQTPHWFVIEAGRQANRPTHQHLRFRMKHACGYPAPCPLLVDASKPPREIHDIVARYFPERPQYQECVCCSRHGQPPVLRITSPRLSSSARNEDVSCCTRARATPHSRLISSTMASVLRPFTIPCQIRSEEHTSELQS